jgi:hypothetical protein
MENLESKADLEVMKKGIIRMENKFVAEFYNHLWVEVGYDSFKKTISLGIHEQGFTSDVRKVLCKDYQGDKESAMTLCYDELLGFLVKNTHVQRGEILPLCASIVNGQYQDKFQYGLDRAFGNAA